MPETEVPLTHALATYLAKHLSAKELIGVDDNDTRCVCLKHAEDKTDKDDTWSYLTTTHSPLQLTNPWSIPEIGS